MEISSTTYNRCDLIKVVGRIDSNTAPDLEKAFNLSTMIRLPYPCLR